jgi:phosphopantothenoylcysteine decarboxylase / phosphopantothenate---cysteine ligase
MSSSAVADWHVSSAAGEKMKKGKDGPPALALTENPDILEGVAKHNKNRPRLVVGFAAETSNVTTYAQAKLAKKGCDLIIANDVSCMGETPGGVMGQASNTVHLVDTKGIESWPTMNKDAIAERLVARLAAMLNA